ncbi:signal transducer [Ceraceosorus bombacis]|uniref:Signal transducer n=1 Tax=Ceraceosorus bombacis TaxID=401625 RepID=A0A0P1BRS3_9BASI|nr:signal transducer [Ceraceosorus bombacis]
MDLLNPERQLVHQGRVYRKPEFQELDWVDLQAVLFDNFLIVTRAKKREEDEERSAPAAPKHILVKRPIPIEMMELSGFNEPSISRSIGLSNFNLRGLSNFNLRGGSERESRDLFPFTLHHIGGKMKSLTLYAPSRPARDVWRRKFEEAQGLRAAVQEVNKVFETHTVSDDVFALPSITAIDPEKPPPGIDTGAFHGRVTCAVPFSTPDGRHLIAVGCADGVWIGLRHDPRSLRKVLHLKVVTQCAVLESFGIFVVLADKVLISYSLEALVPSAGSTNAPRPPQKLSGNRDVVFFSVGQLKDRTLLVYMKKKANESVFRALEPVINAPQAESGRGGGGLFSRLGRETKNTDWFRIYKTFFIPSEAYSTQFLRSKLCIVCARGFEIMSLESLQPGTIPDFSQCPRDDPLVQNLVNRVDRAKPLGMFKHSETEFLLCYDAFACYVDRLGEPVRLDHLIEWEGTPHSVAFRAPYVLAFDHRFVEVRDCSTGQLVQLIRASDLRFVSSGASPASDTESSPIILTQRRRASGRMPFDYQHVFELVSNMPTQLVRADTTMTAKTFGSGGSRASTATGWF